MNDMGTTENEFLKLLGNRVRESRKTLKISQERLAELAGVHPTYMSNIENAKVNASIVIIRRIADGLMVPIAQLVDVTQPQIKQDELTTVFIEAMKLSTKEKKVVLETMKGLLAGLSDNDLESIGLE